MMASIPTLEMSREEFAALPPAVRRKCFSASERLRYTHPERAVLESHASPANHSHLARDLLDGNFARPISTRPKSKHTQSFTLRPSNYRSRHVRSELTDADLTPEFARFYGRLPDKIKRGQFSAQERGLLDTRRNGVLVHVTEDHARRISRPSANRSLPSLRSDTSGHVSPSVQSDDDLATLETESDMDEELLSAFRWIDESEPDLSLDDYHSYITNHPEPKARKDPTPAFRRHRSYTNFSLRATGRRSTDQRSGTADGPKTRAPTESWNSRFAPAIPPVPALPDARAAPPPPVAVPPLPPAPVLSEPRASTSQTRSKLEQWGSGWAPTPASHQRQDSTAAPADHYLSPEARLKLRLYLATPSRFDEALEHGFPALPSPAEPSRPSISSRAQSHASRPQPSRGLTFLQDETTPELSLAEDPVDGREHSRKGSSFYASTDSPPPSPRSGELRTASSREFEKEYDPDHYLGAAWTGQGREMTLRMTLTRPDLRADENILYPTSHPYMAAPGPRARFIGGIKKEKDPSVAMVSIMQNPLSLEDLFADQAPVPPPRQEKSGLRKLFSRKW